MVHRYGTAPRRSRASPLPTLECRAPARHATCTVLARSLSRDCSAQPGHCSKNLVRCPRSYLANTGRPLRLARQSTTEHKLIPARFPQLTKAFLFPSARPNSAARPAGSVTSGAFAFVPIRLRDPCISLRAHRPHRRHALPQNPLSIDLRPLGPR